MFKTEAFNQFLFKRIDNAPLVVFRIIFGFLLFMEATGAIFTGWVKRTLVDPDFTFSFIGFEWLQPLPGYGMYFYYAIMGLSGLMVMIGFKYRWSLGLYSLLWTGTYLMQKSSYNNHYYLLIIICLIMLLLPAHRYASIDSRQNKSLRALSMPAWCSWIIIIQLWIVYTYASVAKLYPDWLDTTVPQQLMSWRKHYFLIGDFLQLKWVHYAITYFGIFYDLLIVPLLLWKPTRKVAFIASIFFHIFNSIVFQIGIFPYLSLAFILFFFEPDRIRKIFLRKKPEMDSSEIHVPRLKNVFIAIAGLHFVVQILLPLRHWTIKDDVLWTEEGHRMSWRMMLRTKGGYIRFKVVDKKSGAVIQYIRPKDSLSKKQSRIIATKPDVIWQYVQRLKKQYQAKGEDVSIYALGKISVNGSPYKTLINPNIDLAAEKWNPYQHHDWIMDSKKE